MKHFKTFHEFTYLEGLSLVHASTVIRPTLNGNVHVNVVLRTVGLIVKKIIILSEKKMDEDFAAMWENDNPPDNDDEKQLNEETSEYKIRDGIARYEILATLLTFYYHAKHGEPLSDILSAKPSVPEFKIK